MRNYNIKFNTVLFLIASLSLLSLCLALYLAQLQTLSIEGKQLFQTCSTTWKMGFGSMLGLISGRKFQESTKKDE